MSTTTLSRIKCARCKSYHPNIRQVQFCCRREQFYKECMTFGIHSPHPHAGGYCRGGVSASVAPTSARRPSVNPSTTKIPVSMLEALPSGYFAARPDSTQAYRFFRVSRPKTGRFRGTLKIQTQHGPAYEPALVIWPSGLLTVYSRVMENDLLLVCVDPNGCAISYAEKIGRCMRCNAELTDEESRHYGIGPLCVKHWPHMIDLVAERKGHYVPGTDD